MADAFTKVDSAEKTAGTEIGPRQFSPKDVRDMVKVHGSYVEIALTDGATLSTIDVSLGRVFYVTLGGNRTVPAPSNPFGGCPLLLRFKQDGTGSRLLTFNAVFRFPGGTPPTLTTTASKTDYLAFLYSAVDSKWDFQGISANL